MYDNWRDSGMLIPTLIMAAIAVILSLVAYYQGGGQHIVGMKVSYKMMIIWSEV